MNARASSLIPGNQLSRSGFTVVELLIVIVVVAILAAITIVAYGNIQQRARNVAVISAAGETAKMIIAYTSVNGVYPVVNANLCITAVSGCSSSYGGSSTFFTNMQTVGTLPSSIPISDGDRYGITYTYFNTRTFNGQSQPVALYFWLDGIEQQCGVPNIANSPTGDTFPSTTGYTYGNDASTGRTLCVVSVPGPGA